MKLNHHAPYFPDPCVTLGDQVADEIVTPASDWSCICETDPGGELGGVVAYAHPSNAEAIAVALTACQGLDLPGDAPPGVLARLVSAAYEVLTTYAACYRGEPISEIDELEKALREIQYRKP